MDWNHMFALLGAADRSQEKKAVKAMLALLRGIFVHRQPASTQPLHRFGLEWIPHVVGVWKPSKKHLMLLIQQNFQCCSDPKIQHTKKITLGLSIEKFRVEFLSCVQTGIGNCISFSWVPDHECSPKSSKSPSRFTEFKAMGWRRLKSLQTVQKGWRLYFLNSFCLNHMISGE